MLRFFWRKFLAEQLSASISARIAPSLEKRITEAVLAQSALVHSKAYADLESKMAITLLDKPWKKNLHIPAIELQGSSNAPFMAYSTCCASDFLNPEFIRLTSILGLPLVFHRKYWEWVYILHHAVRTNAVGPGRKALGFAVGTEPLPSAFASLGTHVTATDAPEEIGVEKGWSKGGEHAAKLDDLFHPGVVERADFDKLVDFSVCDMNQMPLALADYDFCWSSCSLEHLGTLKAGLDFVVESVEKTIRIGGIACHTTEFNLSSNDKTVAEGATVLYRKQDILSLIDTLERRGHTVEPFHIAPDTHVLDSFVDTAPYHAPPHLKLELMGYVSTSVGLIIHRGR